MTPFTKQLADGVLRGDRVSLARAITLCESSNHEHEKQAELLLEHVLVNRAKPTKPSFRVGITGPPGAGKSTFVEAIGTMMVEANHRVGVVCIDPSSSRTQGSILGDKTRMTRLSVDERAFVRPSPSRGHLGGIAQHTNDVVLLVETAGFDLVLVETVGLGQSEILVDEVVDMLVLVVPPAMGDELQGVKKGIMEVTDLVVVNKADGPLEDLARHASVDYVHALQLQRRKRADWRPRVRRCSSTTGKDVGSVFDVIMKFRDEMTAVGELQRKREKQAETWMWAEFADQLVTLAKEDDAVRRRGGELVADLARGSMAPRFAARMLTEAFLRR